MKQLYAFGLLACLIGLLTACYRDYSPDAVETAREFALARTRDLPERHRDFIRYTQPQIYENVIFPAVAPVPSSYQRGGALSSLQQMNSDSPLSTLVPSANARQLKGVPAQALLDHMHSCIVWSPPGLGTKVIVVGDGDRRMLHWWPNRLLFRDYIPTDMSLEQASAVAAAYAINSMHYLSVPELNRVRFSIAQMHLTNFDLDEDHGTDPEQGGWEAYVADLTDPDEQTKTYQMTLTWQGNQENQLIVFVGLSASPETPKEWRLLSARVMSKDTFKRFVLSEKAAQDLVAEYRKMLADKEMESQKQSTPSDAALPGVLIPGTTPAPGEMSSPLTPALPKKQPAAAEEASPAVEQPKAAPSAGISAGNAESVKP